MKIFYVYAHPNPCSFNAMLKHHAFEFFSSHKINVKTSDLYQAKFKAVADWEDFKIDKPTTRTQYFLAQQEAWQNHSLADDITLELDKCAWAEHIIFQFPLWWFSTPAILKGWLDRVLVKGFAYSAGKIFNDGLLKGKTASLVVTTQSPETAYQKQGLHQATMDELLLHIHHILRFVGIKTLQPFIAYGAYQLDNSQQNEKAEQFLVYLKNIVASYYK